MIRDAVEFTRDPYNIISVKRDQDDIAMSLSIEDRVCLQINCGRAFIFLFDIRLGTFFRSEASEGCLAGLGGFKSKICLSEKCQPDEINYIYIGEARASARDREIALLKIILFIRGRREPKLPI